MLLRVNIGTTTSPKWITVDAENASALSGVTLEQIVAAITEVDNSKVAKESGKGLSTNDFTESEKTKLAGIASGATKITLSTSVTSTSSTVAATSSAVKTVNDKVTSLQSTVSNKEDSFSVLDGGTF